MLDWHTSTAPPELSHSDMIFTTGGYATAVNLAPPHEPSIDPEGVVTDRDRARAAPHRT
jgi:hypothetical protein